MAERAQSLPAFLSAARLKALAASDILFACAIMAMLALLVLPVPTFLLDLLLALSITLSASVLMTALFSRKALEFSTFPAILLIATIFRLGLNVASTRLILANGHEGSEAAGAVIAAFGGFVMQGNFVIGIIVFAILVIVNFVVITRGSGRIAEVAARFSLDAMPGKQMAIDADLSSGLINETDARARRKQLEDESNFYGAMDGASKYVRGDAIAGLLITLINIVGGILIGVMQQGLTLAEAGQSYTLLTVGDGLVSQIPALIISVAAGILVSKAGVEGSAEKALLAQFAAHPRALGVVSGVLAIFAILPGMPFVPFIILSAAVGAVAAASIRRKAARVAADAKTTQSGARQKAEDDPASMLAMDDLKIELGYGLLPLIAEGAGPKLTDQIKALRRAIAQEIGFVTPPVRILDNMQLAPNDYVIRLKEQEVGRGSVRPGFWLVMDPSGRALDLIGEMTKEPAFGLDAMWVDETQRQSAALRGLTVVDAATVLTTHLTELIRAEAPELLSYAETKKLLDALGDRHRQLISDIIPSVVSVSTVQRILQSLIAERVSIRDLPAILEAIAEAAPGGAPVAQIAEHVRARLARQICGALKAPDGAAPIVTLSQDWERAFAENVTGQGADRQLAMAPSKIQEFVAAALRKLEDAAAAGYAAALVTSAQARPLVRSVIERVRPQTMVLSQAEIHPHVRLRNLGSI
ncbi:MAG: flagellar biosynthesis protein FlhA [Parvularculaceae bacterium]|nr:flagellar biosynthesis protein FlhA [Parvularculaceae bacterium]